MGGGAPSVITERGIVYGLTTNPTKANNFVTAGSGFGSFTATITGLEDKVYYYRAYVISGGGIIYGAQQSFRYMLKTINFNGILLHTHPTDNSTGIQWYNGSYIVTGATSTTDGEANTTKITTTQGSGAYAAQVCADLVAYGYDDWYLPAKDELNAMYQNKVAIGVFSSIYYWSSTEFAIYGAWLQLFDSGFQDSFDKYYTNRVRCVRRD